MLRPIQIEPVFHGFIVRVGCKTLVFESADTLVKELKAYLKNPEKAQREWLMERASNRNNETIPPPPAPGALRAPEMPMTANAATLPNEGHIVANVQRHTATDAPRRIR